MRWLRWILPVGIGVMSFTTGIQSVADGPGTNIPTSHVLIIPVDIYGKQIRDTNLVVEDFKPVSGGKNIASHFHGASASGIPYGTYLMQAGVRGFRSSERLVRVSQPDVIAVIAFAISVEGDLQNSIVSGRIRNAARGGVPLRVRLCAIYGDTTIDVEPNGSGEFSVAQVPNGSYVLIVTSSDSVLKVQPIRIPASAPIDIDIQIRGSG